MRIHITQFSVPKATNLDMPSKSLNVNYIKGQHKNVSLLFHVLSKARKE